MFAIVVYDMHAVHYKHLCWPKPTNYNALYFSRVRRIPSGTQLKVKIHRFNHEILSYHQHFFLVFQMPDDFTAAQLNNMIPMAQSETFPIIHARKSIC
jgi:hypothetical protein